MSKLTQCLKWTIRRSIQCGKVILTLLFVYVTVLMIGLIPVNRDFQPAPENGIEIYVVSNDVHAELILPNQEASRWHSFLEGSAIEGQLNDAEFLAFGWGDRAFFVDTPTWSDFKSTTALNALFLPSQTAVHVSALTNATEIWPNARKVRVSPKQFQAIVGYIKQSFETSADRPEEIIGACYNDNDAFFEGAGNYHFFNT